MRNDREARPSPEEPHSPKPPSANPELATLSGRLRYLFDKVRPVGKPRFTVREVAEAISTGQGIDISAAYINQLCTGARTNPRLSHIQALAAFFGVPAGFLAGDGDLNPIAEQIEQLSAAIAAKEQLKQFEQMMQDPDALVVALKLRGVSSPHLDLVSTVIDQVRRLEGIEHPPEANEQPPQDGQPPQGD